MSRVIRPVIALLLMLIGTMSLLVGPASAVEQGTISVHATWPNGAPSEAVVICFAVTSDAAGNDVLGSKCTDSEQNLAVFGPSDPGLATGVTYYVWQAQVEGEKSPNAGQVTLVGDPIAADIDQNTGNVDVTFAIQRQVPEVPATEPATEPAASTDQSTEPVVVAETPVTVLPTTGAGTGAPVDSWTDWALFGTALLMGAAGMILRRGRGAS